MADESTLKTRSLSTNREEQLRTMANRLRRHCLLSTAQAASGHPSSCFSAAELVSTIFFEFLRYDLEDPDNPANDRFVLSKGHAAPILWAVLAEAGAFPVERLMSLRDIDSDLEGHPTPRNRYVDVATGSLGQGLSNAVGMAFAAKLRNHGNRVFALLGDGESAEGAVSEAAALASHYKLDNLTAVFDINRLGQSDPTMYQHDLQEYVDKMQAQDWKTFAIDGHDIPAIYGTLQEAIAVKGRPTAVIARTLKGKGVSFMENKEGWHGKPVTDSGQLEQALKEIGEDLQIEESLRLRKPSSSPERETGDSSQMEAPNYDSGDKVATRQAYGSGLRKLGAVRPDLVVLDADTKNSTYSERFLEAFPDRFIECYIAEQNMIGTAAGLASMGMLPYASTFACFMTRAFDQVRMAAISQVHMVLCGSHAGISIGEDGPSQMGLEDLAMMRAVAGSSVLYPSDAVSAERMVQLAADSDNIVYIRTSRPKTPILYQKDEKFEIGGSKTLRSGENDRATVVAAGITLHEALAAAEELAEQDIQIRVIDLYSVKPVDVETLKEAARDTGIVISVEDHYPEGGLGDAVQLALADTSCTYRRIAVNGLPRSGSKDALLDRYGISKKHIVNAVRELI